MKRHSTNRISVLAVVGVLISCQSAIASGRHRVAWVGEDENYTAAIQQAIHAAMNDGGIVEFDAGRTYPCDTIRIGDSLLGGRPYMPRGIEGNGATLVKRSGSDPQGSFFYCWATHKDANGDSNKDFYIRNLTIDGKYNTHYGFRIWGSKDFVVENVTARRCRTAGITIEGSEGRYFLEDVTLRNVFSHENLGHGILIRGNKNRFSAQDVKLESCFGHYNDGPGISIQSAQNVFLVGCGAERNAGPGFHIGSTARPSVGKVVILGGYTEHNAQPYYRDYFTQVRNDPDIKEKIADHTPLSAGDLNAALAPYAHPSRTFDFTTPPPGATDSAVFTDWLNKYNNDYVPDTGAPPENVASPAEVERDVAIFIRQGQADDVTILGGRFIGTFDYDAHSLSSTSLISSYGHVRRGGDLARTLEPTLAQWPNAERATAVSGFEYASPAINAKNSQNQSPDGDLFYIWAAPYSNHPASAALRNVHVAAWHPGNDHTQAITDAIAAAKASGGVLAFQPWKTYRTAPIVIEQVEQPDGEPEEQMMVGIQGNNATLVPLASDPGAPAGSFVRFKRLHGSAPPTNDAHYFHRNAFINDLHINLHHHTSAVYGTAMELDSCRFFMMQDCHVLGRGGNAISLLGYEENGVYTSAFENIAAKLGETGIYVRGYRERDSDPPNPAASMPKFVGNVTFHNSEVTQNTNGIVALSSSIAFNKVHIHNNEQTALRSRHSWSIDVLKSDVTSHPVLFNFEGVQNGVWSAGAHVVAGDISPSGQINFLHAPNSYRLLGSLIYSNGIQRLQNAKPNGKNTTEGSGG